MADFEMNDFKWNGYAPGHPWYYVLGGIIKTPKQIIKHVQYREYKGYMEDDIEKANNKPEPSRSEALREIKEKIIKDYRRDVSRYRSLTCELRAYRRQRALNFGNFICEEIHTAISLKYNHLFNDFAHLLLLDDLLSYQLDLFD